MLTNDGMERVIGAVCLLERDGVWVLIALFVAAAASVVVSGVVIGLLQAGFYGVERWLQRAHCRRSTG